MHTVTPHTLLPPRMYTSHPTFPVAMCLSHSLSTSLSPTLRGVAGPMPIASSAFTSAWCSSAFGGGGVGRPSW